MTKPSARFVQSVFGGQLLIAAVVLLSSVAILLFQPDVFADARFFGGLVLVILVSGLTAVVPWTRFDRRVLALMPLLDIVAIVAIRQSAPLVGAGLFLIFPVIWLARDYGRLGAGLGVGLSTALLWTSRLIEMGPATPRDLAGMLLLPVTLCFVAVTVQVTTRRARAQRQLLRQQTALVETALERARRQEQQLDKVINAVEFGVVAFDAQGNVTHINDSHRRTLQRFNARPGSFWVPAAYHLDRVTQFTTEDRPAARAARGQVFDDLVFWAGEPGGDRAAYAATSRRVYTSSGEYDGGVMVIRDVTAELVALQARDDLVAAVSHELRSPLTSMLGYLDLALDDPTLSAEGRSRIDVAYRNSERLLRIVGDLLRTANDTENQHIDLEIERMELGAVIDEAIEAHRVFASDQHITLGRTDDIAVEIDADPLRVRQILDNLITNGIKYNSEKGRVDISILVDDAAVSVAVTDTGDGISERDVTLLFERYFRTDRARSSSVQGTGLGLGISRTYARQHGGDLTASSEIGSGSTFVLRLPTSVGQTRYAIQA